MELDLRHALSRHFGHDAFRKGQEAVVRSVLSGRPTIAILPTGGGKSLCYQLPALLLEGTTVVVSPLIALMKDQVDALVARGIAATFINSTLTEPERQERQAALHRGELRLVYVAPERFRSSSFLAALSGVRVPLLAIDEAHCISAWGHDFRPEYQRLAQARAQIGAERVLALTATATPEVRQDIAQALELSAPRVFVAGFDRPNLFIEVLPVRGDKDKLGRLVALAQSQQPGLVYAATRKNVEKVVGALRASGVDALGYHAGMDDGDRIAVQDRFLRGAAPVVVATNAFGMGVDKPDIRFVAHFDIPRSLEAYFQEIGRAGRDGNASLALLLFNYADVMMQRRMIDSGRPSRELVSAVWESARQLREGSLDALAGAAAVNSSEAAAAVRILESAGHLERSRGRGGEFNVLTPSVAAGDLAVDFDLLEMRMARERQMLDRLVRFADTRGCRRQNLLRYFGDADAPRSCDACESCKGSRAPAPVEAGPIRTSRRRAPAPETGSAVDLDVFEKLRTLRSQLAREAHVPPYVVFHDATLRELARALPASESDFLAVRGAGPGRWEKYGARVVAITGASSAAAGEARSGVAAEGAAAGEAHPSAEGAFPGESHQVGGSAAAGEAHLAAEGLPSGRARAPAKSPVAGAARSPAGDAASSFGSARNERRTASFPLLHREEADPVATGERPAARAPRSEPGLADPGGTASIATLPPAVAAPFARERLAPYGTALAGDLDPRLASLPIRAAKPQQPTQLELAAPRAANAAPAWMAERPAELAPPAWMDDIPAPTLWTSAAELRDHDSAQSFDGEAAPPGPVAEKVEKLCRAGATLREIARDTGLAEGEAASLLLERNARGQRLDAGRLVGSERVAAIRAAAHAGDGDLVAVRRRLAFTATLAEIRLALLEHTSPSAAIAGASRDLAGSPAARALS